MRVNNTSLFYWKLLETQKAHSRFFLENAGAFMRGEETWAYFQAFV